MAAGPLQIGLVAREPRLLDVIATSLALYDVTWTFGHTKQVVLECVVDDGDGLPAAQGRYLQAAQMSVDPVTGGLRATTTHGAELNGTFDDRGERWQMQVPSQLVDQGLWPEIEDLLSLVLTTGWRRAGWVPLHAAALVDGSRGLVVCATSGGGKTTFMMALVRAGWRSLGDDKLLLRTAESRTQVVALKHMLNVDPAVDAWFPEIGDLRRLPEYSAWTPKRRVALSSLWPESTALSMRPTTVIRLERRPGRGAFEVEPLSAASTVATLLRQTVIPNSPDQARWIMRELAACAGAASGIRVLVGDDAYVNRAAIAQVERAVS